MGTALAVFELIVSGCIAVMSVILTVMTIIDITDDWRAGR